MTDAPASAGAITRTQLAALFDCSERTVDDLAKRGILVRVGRGKFNPPASIRAYVRHLREVAAGRGGGALDLAQERARLAAAQADATEMKNAIARGEYVRGEDVEREWSGILRDVQRQMLGLPSKLQQRLSGLTRHDVEVIDETIRQSLHDAADGIAARPDPTTTREAEP